MKFIHVADMHFDTPFTLLSNKKGLGETRRIEQRKAFRKMITHIQENKIPYLFIAGDLYEHNYVKQSTIDFMKEQFSQIPETQIYIAPGNHDPYLTNSYYAQSNWGENVTIFTGEIQKIEQPEFTLYGYGFTDFYCENAKIENIILDKNKLNLLLIHGELNASLKKENNYNPISENELKKIGFDYVALGHIHKRGQEANSYYPGSMISMGFDELGKHGMLEVELTKEERKVTFIPLDEKEFSETKIEISNMQTIEEIAENINEQKEENTYQKMILTGNRSFEINMSKLEKLITHPTVIKIKDQTEIAYSLEEIANQTTLKGLFVQEMLQRKEQAISEEEKQIIERAIEIGMEVLS